MKKLKNNNNGFTMLELVIATAVLTVIMLPLMRAFVIASNTSRQTNIYGETSTAIKNVAELVTGASMSAIDDLDDIEAKLSVFPAYGSSTLDVTRHEFDSSTGWADYNTWLPSGLPASSSEFLENSKVFTLQNANMGNGAGIMEVIVTPISSTASDGDMDYNEWYKDVNNTNFSSFTNMDITMLQPGITVEMDAAGNVSKQEVDLLNHADYKATTYLTGGTGTGVTSYTKEMRITVKKSSNDSSLLTYTVEYYYTGDSKSIDYTIFTGDAGYGDDGVCSIQIAYYPFYAPTSSITPTVTNKVTVNNTQDLPVKLFLMKQDMSGYPLATLDTSTITIGSNHDYYYDCATYLNESSSSVVTNPATRIYTNMAENVIESSVGMLYADTGFEYWFGGTKITDQSLKDRLVADDSGGRAFNVHVNAYQKKLTGTGYDLVDQITTVKLI